MAFSITPEKPQVWVLKQTEFGVPPSEIGNGFLMLRVEAGGEGATPYPDKRPKKMGAEVAHSGLLTEASCIFRGPFPALRLASHPLASPLLQKFCSASGIMEIEPSKQLSFFYLPSKLALNKTYLPTNLTPNPSGAVGIVAEPLPPWWYYSHLGTTSAPPPLPRCLKQHPSPKPLGPGFTPKIIFLSRITLCLLSPQKAKGARAAEPSEGAKAGLGAFLMVVHPAMSTLEC